MKINILGINEKSRHSFVQNLNEMNVGAVYTYSFFFDPLYEWPQFCRDWLVEMLGLDREKELQV